MRNPKKYQPRKIGEPFQELEHPDLFKGWKDARTGKTTSHGETPVFVPLEELTDEQILELPREAFNDAEWAELSEEVKTEILESSVHVPLLDRLTGKARQRRVGKPPGQSYFENIYRTRTDYEDDDWELLTAASQKDVLKRTKRLDITGSDWENLSIEERREIIENDEEAKARVEALVELFVKPYQWSQEPDNDDYIMTMVGDDYFHSWLQENADHLVERADDTGHASEVEALVEEYQANGWSEEEVRRAVDKALQDESNYDKEVSESGFFTDSSTEDQIDISASEISKALVGMDADEIQLAAEEIDRETNGVYAERYGPRPARKLTVDQIKEAARKYGITANVAVEYYVSWDPDWSRISNAMDSILEDLYPDGPEGEPAELKPGQEPKWLDESERVVKKWPDGFFVLDLTPKEMVAEGDALCHAEGVPICIGLRKYGYPQGVERGNAKAFSLRTPSGRSKIAMYVEYTPPPFSFKRIDSIPEVKGKGNRLVGWDLHKAGEGKIKQDEVTKTIDFIANTLRFNPFLVGNLDPALREIGYLVYEKDPWALKVVDLIKKNFPGAAEEATGWLRPRPQRPAQNPAPRGMKAPTCGASDCGGGFCSPRKAPNPAGLTARGERMYEHVKTSYPGDPRAKEIAARTVYARASEGVVGLRQRPTRNPKLTRAAILRADSSRMSEQERQEVIRQLDWVIDRDYPLASKADETVGRIYNALEKESPKLLAKVLADAQKIIADSPKPPWEP